MRCTAFKHGVAVVIRDLLAFNITLKKWSQLDSILVRLNNAKPPIKSIVLHQCDIVDNWLQICDEQNSRANFALEQLRLSFSQSQGRRYSNTTMLESMTLFLCSRSCYRSIRRFLSLLHPSSIRKLFVNSLEQCSSQIKELISVCLFFKWSSKTVHIVV